MWWCAAPLRKYTKPCVLLPKGSLLVHNHPDLGLHHEGEAIVEQHAIGAGEGGKYQVYAAIGGAGALMESMQGGKRY